VCITISKFPASIEHADLGITWVTTGHACVLLTRWPLDLPFAWGKSQGALVGLHILAGDLGGLASFPLRNPGSTDWRTNTSLRNASWCVILFPHGYALRLELNIWYHALNVGSAPASPANDFPCITDARVGRSRLRQVDGRSATALGEAFASTKLRSDGRPSDGFQREPMWRLERRL